jgi:hypothetical protein
MTAIDSTFRSNEPLLSNLLERTRDGKTQLPDFQRGWVWDDDHIRSLVASITLGYPIGAIMLLETGSESVRFKPRLLEGVEISSPPYPEHFVLDGQQRLTSLYLCLFSGKPVKTTNEKKQEIERLYYLDMRICLDPEADRIDAVVSIPPDKMVKSDFGRKIELDVSTREKEFEKGLLPLPLIFDPTGYTTWKANYREYFGHDKDKSRFLDQFDTEIWLAIQKYKVPVIELVKETPKEAVCQVFERVNTGGVALTVFELVTATFAADDFHLRDDWRRLKERLDAHRVLTDVDETAFLTAITLLVSYKRNLAGKGAVSCKRKDILKLSLTEYKENAEVIVEGMVMAARFLARQKVFDEKSLPYATQIIPLSAICAILGTRFEEDPVRQRLAKWYWCGVFGELYGGANETRYALDAQNVPTWISGGIEPATVRDASFAPTRLLTLQTRLSAAYKGLSILLMQVGADDFVSGDAIELTNYFEQAVDIHHIFPKAYCIKENYKQQIWNSIVNKSPLTARTNRLLGGDKPSIYIKSIETKFSLDSKALDDHLRSHLINPKFLRADDFDNSIRDRATRLLDLIEKAIGKSIAGRDSDEVALAFGGKLISTIENI